MEEENKTTIPTMKRTKQDTDDIKISVIKEEENKELKKEKEYLDDKLLDEDVIIPTIEEINTLLSDENINKLSDEYKQILEITKETQESEEISSESIKDYNTRIKDRAEKISDDTFNTLVDNIIENSDIPKDQRIKMKTELLKKLKTQQALIDEMEEARTEFSDSIEKIQVEMDQLFSTMNYTELLSKLQGLIDIAVKHNQTQAVAHYEKLYKEVDNILNLTILIDKITPTNNREGRRIGTLEAYNKTYEKFYWMLANNKTYKFADPSKLLEFLTAALGEDREDDAKIFLSGVYKLITTGGGKNHNKQSAVDTYAVLMEGIIRIIYSLDPKKTKVPVPEIERTKFLEAVEIYLAKYLA